MSSDLVSLHPENRDIVLFTGNYGSGKTEVSVNVVNALARMGEKVTIADLDLVNPYFRCREARETMESLGIRVVAPQGEMHSADLPIVMPEVYGAIQKPNGITVLDVGGDNVGATVVASLANALGNQNYEMCFVLNQNRPFTDTLDGAMRLMDEIEHASKLSISSIVGNTHLMDETDLDMVRTSEEFTLKAAESRGVEVFFITAPMKQLQEADLIPGGEFSVEGIYRLDSFSVPVLPLERIMLPPWLGGNTPGSLATHSRDGFSRLC